MKLKNLAGTRTLSGEEPRSTAYYYADLERLKRKNDSPIEIRSERKIVQKQIQNPDELSEYVEVNFEEISPIRSPPLQWATDGQERKGETYSTAGTFPMPEPKEKEPLLAELEIVGRLPLTQLDTGSGVRRSRSWYLCCPNVEEEASRESSWRYSSLRPVTAPPQPRPNGLLNPVTSQSSGRDDSLALRAERDALARALAAERQRAASEARAHDARLAELHGVIAELVRRREADKHPRAIPEEEVSDECESTTQPAGELDNEADRSRTDQNNTSSALTPSETAPADRPDEETDDTSTKDDDRAERSRVEMTSLDQLAENCDTSLDLSEKDSEICLSSARWCQMARESHSTGGSCEREHGSADGNRLFPVSPGRCESRQAKLASRVRLKRTDCEFNPHHNTDESWCAEAAERLALDVCAQADLREALVAAENDGEALSATVAAWKARCLRLEADCTVLQCALFRATDTAQRLSCACAVQESSCVAICSALKAADRALEAYDVLLALAETNGSTDTSERSAAELVARQLLSRLDAEQAGASVGQPLLSPGPWLQHDNQALPESGWDTACESRLRTHAARLKADTVTLRTLRPPPAFFSYHDADDEEVPVSARHASMAEMETAVMMQEMLSAKEARAVTRAAALAGEAPLTHSHKTGSSKSRRRHWLDSHAETDL